MKLLLKQKYSPRIVESDDESQSSRFKQVNSNGGGVPFNNTNFGQTQYSVYRGKNVRLKRPYQGGSVPRNVVTRGFIMTEDAEIEGIVSQFNQTSRLEFENQIAMATDFLVGIVSKVSSLLVSTILERITVLFYFSGSND